MQAPPDDHLHSAPRPLPRTAHPPAEATAQPPAQPPAQLPAQLHAQLPAQLPAQPPAQPPPVGPQHRPLTRKQKKAQRANHRRAIKRATAQLQGGTGLKGVSIKKRHLSTIKGALKLPVDIKTCGAATGPGWVGRPLHDLPQNAFTLEDLKSEYSVVCFEWDGMYVLDRSATASAHRVPRSPHLLLDRENRVVGVLAGRPLDPGWGAVHDSALSALESAAPKMRLRPKDAAHRRGSYPSVSHGISFGGGQEVRISLFHGRIGEHNL